MSGFTINFTFKDNAYCEMYNGTIKFWAGYGIPDYEGGFEGFDMLYPKYMQELIDNGIIVRTE